MTATGASARSASGSPAFGGRTAWARNLAAPVRSFLSTESGGAGVLLAATVAALAWANSPWSSSYESVWTTELSIRLGGGEIALPLREWVNQGLMTFFFLVVGLEAKRELDTGALRERRRITIALVAALAGMAVPVVIYLAFNAGGPGAHGWGAAMSTDTAFAHLPRVAADVASADASGVAGTPTFFINGRRHRGAYDAATLTESVRAELARARLRQAA